MEPIFIIVALYVLLLILSVIKKTIQYKTERKKDTVVTINVQLYVNGIHKKQYSEKEMKKIGLITRVLLSDKEKVDKAVKEN